MEDAFEETFIPPEAGELLALQRNPTLFMREWLGTSLWEKQETICNKLIDHKKVAVRSCHGSGKTFLAARIALWWLFTRPFSAVLTTAPTNRQVVELLWKEIRVAYKDSRVQLGGNLLPKAPKLFVDDDWLLIGFSTDNPVNFQGWHSKGGTLVIMDEAPGVHVDIWNSIEGVLVSASDRMLCIGNPVEPYGPFFEMFKQSDVGKVHISAYDTPNVSAGADLVPGLCSAPWVEEKKEQWGEDSPLWQARVLGEFPSTHDSTVVPLDWAHKANERWEELASKNLTTNQPVHLGVDVARMGSDYTVIAEYNEDFGILDVYRLNKQETMATVGDVVEITRNKQVQSIFVDADGLGAGVYDRLVEVFDGDGGEILTSIKPVNTEGFCRRHHVEKRAILDEKAMDFSLFSTLHESLLVDGCPICEHQKSLAERDRLHKSPPATEDKLHESGSLSSRCAKSSMESGAYGATAGGSTQKAQQNQGLSGQIPKSAMNPGGYGVSCPKIRAARGGTRPKISDRFFNSRAEWYWNLRERLNPNSENPICLPIHNGLLQQITSIRWRLNSKGQIRIESKDEMRTRGMQSPDEADAVVYALAAKESFVDFVLV